MNDPNSTTKRCPFCAEEIQPAAIVCKHCGRDLVAVAAPAQSASPVQQGWNPGVAALLSLVIPGAGQLYKNQIGRGFLYFLAALGGYVLFVLPGLVVHFIAIMDAAMVQPAGTGQAAQQVTCIDCKKASPRGGSACPYCGHVFGTQPGSPKLAASATTIIRMPVSAHEVQCMACGAVNTRGPWKCAQCGSAFAKQ